MQPAQLAEVKADFNPRILEGRSDCAQLDERLPYLTVIRQHLFRARQHFAAAGKFGQRLQRGAQLAVQLAREMRERRHVLRLHGVEQFGFGFRRDTGFAYQRAEHRHMSDVEMQLADAGKPQRVQHQALHFDVAFNAGMPVDFGADLQRFARAVEPHRQCVQNAAGVAQAIDALAVHQVRIDARHLRRDVGAHAERASRQLVDQFERAQIQIVPGAGQQRFHVLEQRRQHQLVAVQRKEVEHGPPQRFDAARRLRQYVLYIFRQQPFTHGGSGCYKKTTAKHTRERGKSQP